jgi:23S rRNA (adenine2030-N6)-methyltransferase
MLSLMNYQHYFHAGNSSDVFKHLVLLTLLSYLKEKEKPFCYIDTHAGSGIYNLLTETNKEWKDGIGRLHSHSAKHPLLKQYLEWTKDSSHFPGSPEIARKMIRPQDEIILIEKAENPFLDLKRLSRNNQQIHMHNNDAYLTLKSLLPPKIKRGLILIDPPYEAKDEFEKLILLLKESLKKFPIGIYALWYPIKSRALISRVHRELRQNISAKMTAVEFCPWPDDIAIRLNGSGLIIINPPWQLEKTLSPLLEELIICLKQHPKGFWHFPNFS